MTMMTDNNNPPTETKLTFRTSQELKEEYITTGETLFFKDHATVPIPILPNGTRIQKWTHAKENKQNMAYVNLRDVNKSRGYVSYNSIAPFCEIDESDVDDDTNHNISPVMTPPRSLKRRNTNTDIVRQGIPLIIKTEQQDTMAANREQEESSVASLPKNRKWSSAGALPSVASLTTTTKRLSSAVASTTVSRSKRCCRLPKTDAVPVVTTGSTSRTVVSSHAVVSRVCVAATSSTTTIDAVPVRLPPSDHTKLEDGDVDDTSCTVYLSELFEDDESKNRGSNKDAVALASVASVPKKKMNNTGKKAQTRKNKTNNTENDAERKRKNNNLGDQMRSRFRKNFVNIHKSIQQNCDIPAILKIYRNEQTQLIKESMKGYVTQDDLTIHLWGGNGYKKTSSWSSYLLRSKDSEAVSAVKYYLQHN